jgi:hypothetical protein
MSIEAQFKLCRALEVHTSELEIEREGGTCPDPKPWMAGLRPLGSS